MLNTIISIVGPGVAAVVAQRFIPGVTPAASTSMQTIVAGNLATAAILHPKKIIQTVTQGASGALSLLRNEGIQSHAILRTTQSVLTEELQNAAAAQVLGQEAVIEAVNQGTENVTSTLASALAESMCKQQKVMLLCALIPASVIGFNLFVKQPAIEKTSLAMLEKIPSKEYISEIVKTELSKRGPVVKPALIVLTAEQVFMISSVTLISGCVVLLVYLKLKENKSSLRKLN